MKSIMILGILIFFLTVSGLHGLMWVLRGITDSYQNLINDESHSIKKNLQDFMGKLFLLFLACVGIHRIFWYEIPELIGKIF